MSSEEAEQEQPTNFAQLKTEEEQQKTNETLIQLEGRYAYYDGKSKIEEDECKVKLTNDFVSIDSKNGAHYEFGYRELSQIKESDYEADLVLAGSNSSFHLSYLGTKYNDFLSYLYSLRNDQLEKDLLIQEGKPSIGAIGKFSYSSKDSEQPILSWAESRIYKTKVAFFPKAGEPICLRFSDITSFRFQDYTAEFQARDGSTISISELGSLFESFERSFTTANSALLQESNTLIKEVCPTISSSNLFKLSRKMLDGIPIATREVSLIEPRFLRAVELQISENSEDLLRSLEYLYSIGEKESSCIGIKRFVTDFLYLLIPLKGKNAVALETNEKGHATYFFRLGSLEEIDALVSALREINFRREPVYLSNDDLLRPQYAKYMFSIQRIKSLPLLRKQFLGRAIHSDYESWKNQVDEIVKTI